MSSAMTVESADLVSTVVLHEPMAYVAAPTSDLAGKRNLALHDLAGHALLVPKHDCAYRMKLQRDLAAANDRVREVHAGDDRNLSRVEVGQLALGG
jgi:DNA-binding transcriptional LysR family regulator